MSSSSENRVAPWALHLEHRRAQVDVEERKTVASTRWARQAAGVVAGYLLTRLRRFMWRFVGIVLGVIVGHAVQFTRLSNGVGVC